MKTMKPLGINKEKLLNIILVNYFITFHTNSRGNKSKAKQNKKPQSAATNKIFYTARKTVRGKRQYIKCENIYTNYTSGNELISKI